MRAGVGFGKLSEPRQVWRVDAVDLCPLGRAVITCSARIKTWQRMLVRIAAKV